MASATIKGPESGVATAKSGFVLSRMNIKKAGGVVCVYFSVATTSGDFPLAQTAVATIPEGFRPTGYYETPLLASENSDKHVFKASIGIDGTVTTQGFGTQTGSWVNISATYIAV